MHINDQIEFFEYQLFENAVKKYKETEQYGLLKEKLDRMDTECDSKLMKDQKDSVQECFYLIMEIGSDEEHYIYRKGLRDGIAILKHLNVIS